MEEEGGGRPEDQPVVGEGVAFSLNSSFKKRIYLIDES